MPAHLDQQSYSASLTIHAESLTRRSIEDRLGPTDVPYELYPNGKGLSSPDKVGTIWYKDSTVDEYEPLSRHVAEILDFVVMHLETLRDIEREGGEWRIFCGVFVASHEGVEDAVKKLPRRMIEYIEENDIVLDIDVI